MDVNQIDTFPYIKLSYKETYKSETLKYDQLAMKYLSYVLYPLSLGFSVYSLLYRLRIAASKSLLAPVCCCLASCLLTTTLVLQSA